VHKKKKKTYDTLQKDKTKIKQWPKKSVCIDHIGGSLMLAAEFVRDTYSDVFKVIKI